MSQSITQRIDEDEFQVDDLISLAQHAGKLLSARNATICAAESCTGGLILSSLTDIAGSSAYVLGGVVTYSNEAKMQLVGVPAATLEAHGAVSEPTARVMAEGARQLFRADYALSVTGIAGPGGGTPTKPVGLVYVGLAGPEGTKVERCLWESDRIGNKRLSAAAALRLLIAALEA